MPDTTTTFAGHLGHLTDTQQTALTTFKQNLASANLYTPASTTGSPPSHDDTTLLRFLRARNFNPSAAQKQFADAESWRKEHDVNGLYASFDAEEFELAKRFYPRWTGRRDKTGLPLYVYRIASIVPLQSEIEAVPPDRRYQRIIALYELMTRFSFPLCSHLPRPHLPPSNPPIPPAPPVSSTTTIVDLSNVSLTSLWRLRSHLQTSSRLATLNYPETLHTILIVNSPSFFPTVWGWIKGWFDPGTRDKISVLGRIGGDDGKEGEAVLKLREVVNVEDLARVYGGELDWEYEHEPRLDEHARRVLGEMPKGPAIFVDGKVAKPEIPSLENKKQNGLPN
ncbi:hypothetical protein AX17_003692 [Amanita inopinata Kibby_2008]|nr:hypothetical protein AX17_003692 [Amanita inopinata Kibby_2008]